MSLLKKIFKYVWPQVQQHQMSLYSVIVLFTVRLVLGFIIIPFYFKTIIDTISGPGVDPVLISPTLFKLVLIIIGLDLIVILTAKTREFLYLNFVINVTRNLRNFAFQKIEQNSQTFFANTFAGSLVTKSRRFVYAFDLMSEMVIYGFLQIFVILIGVFVVLFQQSLTIGTIFLGLVVVYMTTVAFFIKKKIKYDLLEAEQDSRISGRLADVFGNISAVKFFSARSREIKSFGRYTDEGAERSRRAWYFGAKIEIVQNIFSFIIHSTLLYLMIRLWINGDISTGTVVLVQTYMVIVLSRLWELSKQLTRFMKSASDMKELIDIFEVVPDILDPKNPEKLKMNKGHIIFKDVSFRYANSRDVLNNFNLEITPGERVGLVGHSGAGKSTLTRLLLRSSDVTGGAITIDGQDIRNVTQDDLRSVISYVPQEPILFHRPIKENIAYGRPDASEEEIIEVAKKAHAHEFVSSLAKGYDTLVGERGVKLSGGERQRVAIARAMLKDSPILILDEATSSLDSVSEHYIQDAFTELMKGKTTIVIAHRLSTIQKMNRIIVLDEGVIVEQGTHQELLIKKGVYADLWAHQSGGFLE